MVAFIGFKLIFNCCHHVFARVIDCCIQ